MQQEKYRTGYICQPFKFCNILLVIAAAVACWNFGTIFCNVD